MSDPTKTLVVYLLIYLAVFVCGLLGVAATGKIVGEWHKIKASKDNVCIDSHAHGVFASTIWPIWLRGPISLLITVFGLMPCTIITICFILGPILAVCEDWDSRDGILYILSNLLGLITPLTNDSPTSSQGMALDVVLSLWAMLMTTTAIGIIAGLSLICHWTESIPDTLLAFLRYTFLYMPAIIVSSCFCLGAILAGIEGWSLSDGFYFVVASICQMANPLVDTVPETAAGMFVEVISVCVELGCAGAAIGIIGGHPITRHALRKIEGSDVNKRLEDLVAEMTHLDAEHNIKSETLENAIPIARLLRGHGFLPAHPTIEELNALFLRLDKDGNGVLDVEEVKQSLAVIGVAEKDTMSIFESMDLNGDGKISRNELINATAERIISTGDVQKTKSANLLRMESNADVNRGTCKKEHLTASLGKETSAAWVDVVTVNTMPSAEDEKGLDLRHEDLVSSADEKVDLMR